MEYPIDILYLKNCLFSETISFKIGPRLLRYKRRDSSTVQKINFLPKPIYIIEATSSFAKCFKYQRKQDISQ